MGNRRLASWCTLAIVVAAWASGPSRSAAQTPASQSRKAAGVAAARWSPPRTPDGQPDLQGVWISRSATPLERPKALEGRDRLTDEEVAELQHRAGRIFNSGNADFAAGDAVFLAALENRAQFKSPTSTHGADEMVEREFDQSGFN